MGTRGGLFSSIIASNFTHIDIYGGNRWVLVDDLGAIITWIMGHQNVPKTAPFSHDLTYMGGSRGVLGCFLRQKSGQNANGGRGAIMCVIFSKMQMGYTGVAKMGDICIVFE